MKFILFILLPVISFAQKYPCKESDLSTNQEIIECALKIYKETDSKLNKEYQKLIQKIDIDKKNLLINAQKKWIEFRDAQCKYEASFYEGGSIQPTIKYDCLTELALKRIEELKSIMSKIDE